jgi:hypothetical protein
VRPVAPYGCFVLNGGNTVSYSWNVSPVVLMAVMVLGGGKPTNHP